MRVVDARDHHALQDALESPADDASFGIDLRAVRSDGAAMTVHFRGAAYPRTQGHGIILRGILQDVTERRELSRIKYQAGHDVLTGLANRAALLAELEAALRNRRRRPDRGFAVHFVDLDRFKEVNDSLGHLAGDAVLKGVAERLREATREDDLVARLGGDEMVVLQKHVTSAAAAKTLASRIIASIGKPMDVAGRQLAARRQHRRRDGRPRDRDGRGAPVPRRPRDVPGQGDAPRQLLRRLTPAARVRRAAPG